MAQGSRVRAWRPAVAGIDEVFHARFVDHAYPPHTHATWTLLVVDDGAVRYDLDRAEHGAVGPAVTLLPPGVAHDGRSATPGGFRKRVLYLDDAALPAGLVGRAVDRPPIGVLSCISSTTSCAARSTGCTTCSTTPATSCQPRPVSRSSPHVTPAHLVTSFSTEFGLPPHRYLVGRRVDLARRLLLAGVPAARVAVEAGFHDQAHLTRHFRRVLGVPPGRYARSALRP